MNPKTIAQITDLLHESIIPNTNLTLQQLGKVKSIEMISDDCFVSIELGFHAKSDLLLYQNFFKNTLKIKT